MRRLRLTRNRLVALIALVSAIVWAARVNVPALSGRIKGDEATYVAMALSVAKDGDLKFRAEDLTRFQKVFGTGPEGIFLKQTHRLDWHFQRSPPWVTATRIPVPTGQELDFGKSFAYAVAAAPFVTVLGLPGLLLFNIFLLAVCCWCAVTFCKARTGPIRATVFGLAFVLASVVPVYVAWLTTELFNVTLVFVACLFWLYKEVAPPDDHRWFRRRDLDWVSAVLLGIATFSKLTNAPLIAPIVMTALLRKRYRHATLVAGSFLLATGILFGANELIAGDWNYQGGIRKSFVRDFPFDAAGSTFESAGKPMTTEEANDQNILAPDFLFPLLKHNVVYFLVGRDAGLVPYFFPGVVIGVLWLVRWRRSTVWQWMTALACVGSALVLLVLTPASWNGGGGPVGNRYFLSIYPTMLFLLPSGAGIVSALTTAIVGLTFVGPILLHPFRSSQEVWRNPERWPLRLLPVELTLMNDLPVRLNRERGRVQVSENPEVFLYYMDSNTYFQEANGFWVAPGTTDIVIRTALPLTRLTLRLSSRVPNEVDVAIDGRSGHASLQPGDEEIIQLRPPSGVYANTSYQIVLRIRTASGFYPRQFDPSSTDTRHLGVFVKPTYEVN
jgi:hypothetical protein